MQSKTLDLLQGLQGMQSKAVDLQQGMQSKAVDLQQGMQSKAVDLQQGMQSKAVDLQQGMQSKAVDLRQGMQSKADANMPDIKNYFPIPAEFMLNGLTPEDATTLMSSVVKLNSLIEAIFANLKKVPAQALDELTQELWKAVSKTIAEKLEALVYSSVEPFFNNNPYLKQLLSLVVATGFWYETIVYELPETPLSRVLPNEQKYVFDLVDTIMRPSISAIYKELGIIYNIYPRTSVPLIDNNVANAINAGQFVSRGGGASVKTKRCSLHRIKKSIRRFTNKIRH